MTDREFGDKTLFTIQDTSTLISQKKTIILKDLQIKKYSIVIKDSAKKRRTFKIICRLRLFVDKFESN